MAGLAGKNMRLQFTTGPVNLRITRGSLTARTQVVETTNSESSGHEEFVYGVDGADLDADVIYTYSSPALYSVVKNGIGAGNTPVGVLFSLFPEQGTPGSTFTGTVMIESFAFTGEVKGALTAKIVGKVNAGLTGTSV